MQLIPAQGKRARITSVDESSHDHATVYYWGLPMLVLASGSALFLLTLSGMANRLGGAFLFSPVETQGLSWVFLGAFLVIDLCLFWLGFTLVRSNLRRRKRDGMARRMVPPRGGQ